MKRVYAASFLSSCIDEHDEQHNIGLMYFANMLKKSETTPLGLGFYIIKSWQHTKDRKTEFLDLVFQF